MFNGNATYDLYAGTTPTGFLTSGAYNKAGTMIYNNPITTDSFTVTFQVQPGADGLGFMLETNGPTALGGASGGFGMAGLSGFGVELDLYQNDCGEDPPAIHVGIDDLSQVCGLAEMQNVLV